MSAMSCFASVSIEQIVQSCACFLFGGAKLEVTTQFSWLPSEGDDDKIILVIPTDPFGN